MISKPSICFFNTSGAMPHMLLGEGPDRAGGAEIRASLLARALAERGWPMSFAIRDYGQPDEMTTAEGIRVLRASGQKKGLPFLRILTHTIPADLRAFRAADADIYVEFGVTWRTGILSRECRKRNRRYVLWLASATCPYIGVPAKAHVRGPMRRLAYEGLREADLVLAQTEVQKDLMLELHNRECPVVPNVWPLENHSAPKVSPPEVLWAGRYANSKRPELVLEVAKRLPDIRFKMAGGPGQEALFNHVRAAAARIPNLEVLGFVPFREIGEHYARASAYLCTSAREGFPNTFLQAWSHSNPIVSTVDPDNVLARHGIGIACRDVDELSQGVLRACSSEGRTMGAMGRAYLERVHNTDVVVPMLERLLLDLG